jgi:hypothetical protein
VNFPCRCPWRVSETRAADISGYADFRRKEGASPQTINHELRILSKAFDCAMKNEMIFYKPLIQPECVDNTRTIAVSEEDAVSICKNMPEDVAAAVETDHEIGGRISEILSLRWHQINFEER